MKARTKKLLGFLFCVAVAVAFAILALSTNETNPRAGAWWIVGFSVLGAIAVLFSNPMDS